METKKIFPLLKTTVGHKIVIGFLLAIVFVGGISYYLYRYYEIFSEMGQQASRNPLQQQAVDLDKLEQAYRDAFTQIINSYLSLAESNVANLSEQSAQAQQQLLALKVPPSDDFRSKHLATVLALGEIERLAKSGQQDQVTTELTELKKLTKF
ncbi:MAG: hypothetical protein WC516_07560 [Patescibacteria group bacterium]